jgi:hypothetical protein
LVCLGAGSSPEEQVLQYGIEAECGKEREGARDDDDAYEQEGEKRCCHGRRAGGGWDNFLACDVISESEHRDEHHEASEEHRKGEGIVVPAGGVPSPLASKRSAIEWIAMFSADIGIGRKLDLSGIKSETLIPDPGASIGPDPMLRLWS